MATIVSTNGFDEVLIDAPPLVAPPLSLLDLVHATLIDLDGETAVATEANEKAMSAQARASDIADRMAGGPPGSQTLAELEDQYAATMDSIAEWQQKAIDAQKRLAERMRWEKGFVYLPELSIAAMETWAPDTVVNEAAAGNAYTTTATKNTGINQTPTAWYDPFVAIARDARSTMGYSTTTDITVRMQRAVRALKAHEAWQCEREFWSGGKIPTNWHLSASPSTPTSSPHRTITNWANPTPASGTALGVAVGLTTSLSALDQSIADADAGIGCIHATPFLVQEWSRTYPFIRDSAGRNLTVNGNLIVPGYGYPGTGPDQASRTVTDGAVTSGGANLTSASGAFTTLDLGSAVSGTNIPAGAYIVAITSATVAVMNVNATGTGSGETVVIGGGVGSLAGQRYQWAYATDPIYHLRGDVHTYPWDLRQASPSVPSLNALDVRAERSHALIGNQLLRAAVLVDTQLA
jgi:hypothetical protein